MTTCHGHFWGAGYRSCAGARRQTVRRTQVVDDVHRRLTTRNLGDDRLGFLVARDRNRGGTVGVFRLNEKRCSVVLVAGLSGIPESDTSVRYRRPICAGDCEISLRRSNRDPDGLKGGVGLWRMFRLF